jgi:hypothetical protein
MLYAVVYQSNPSKIIKEMGAPFEGETLEEAEEEVNHTYGTAFLLGMGKLVPLTPELEAQYKELEGT